MKKRQILLLVLVMCVLSAIVVFAENDNSSIRITDDKTIEYNKEELLAALYEADIESIREALDMKLITCRELAEYYLERIEEYNPTFNCFITLCDNVLAEADKCDAAIADGTAEGKLFGVPIVVKDNIEYEGYYTTNGLKFEKSKISEVNATIVQHLLDEGAIIIGKGNMSTEAQDARRTSSKSVGETYNAYNTELASGGSSGGSAVATSLNFATASLGTDTNSSLRFPAALNGCVSLRPTFGLLDKTGCIILNRRRDTAGAITRTVKDQAIMLDVLIGGGTYAENLNVNALEGMRIGILKNLSYAVPNMSKRTEAAIDDEVAATFANAVEELKACGAEVIEVSLPKIFTMSNNCSEDKAGWAEAKEEYYAAFEKLLADNNITAVIFPTYLSAPQYTGTAADGGLLVYDQPWTSNCSVLASPLGLPEISVPIGQHSRGAGIGMEIASLKNSEQLLLDIAYSYTEKYDHRVTSALAPNLYEDSNAGDLETFLATYKEALAEVERLEEEERKEQETTTPEPETTTETSVEQDTTPEEGTTAIENETTSPEPATTAKNPTESLPNSGELPGDEKTSVKVDWGRIATIFTVGIVVIIIVVIVGMIIYDRYRSRHRRKYKKYRKYLGKKKQ